MINGFKCFNKGLINSYGEVFLEGGLYHMSGDIKFQKNGFHMCRNLEDTLRYFDGFNSEVDIASVQGYGVINKYSDEYNGFYDMYAVEYLKIVHILSRREIIKYVLNLPPYRVCRFVSLFKLNADEINLFYNVFAKEIEVIKTIEYYQKGNDKAFVKIK